MVNIEALKKEYDELLKQLGDPGLISDWQRFQELTQKKSNLEKVIAKGDEIRDLQNKIEENKEIIKAGEDGELISMAETESKQLEEKEKILEKELQDILQGKNTSQKTAVIMEIRAGAGGNEAAIFAGDLYRMYARYAEKQSWKIKVLDSHRNEVGGFKEIIFSLEGLSVLDKMRGEGGVHRVQRIPVTEKQGRVHTSTASVAVLHKPEKTQIKINPSDLKFEVAKATGPGGQNVNKRMTAVRVVHLPTGLAVDSHTERNLQQNKENAVAILEARLQQLKEKQELAKVGEKRRSQIKGAERSDKIRTYNFPQDRVTDHRIGKSFHNIEAIMDGDLDSIIKALSS